MNITSTERTIVEYSLTLTAEDAQLALTDPYGFADLVGEQLRPLLPSAAPTRKPGPRSQITIGRKVKAKPAAGAKLPKVACPECGKSIATKFLPLHQAKKHSASAAE